MRRRTAVLSGLVLVGGLLGPSTALASEDDEQDKNQLRWIAVEDHFAIVLPNGETFTDDAPEEGAPPEEELPPVGARLFISEVLFDTEDGTTRGDEVGRTHIECTVQVVEFHFLCDAAFVFNGGSQLHGSVAADFSSEMEEFQLVVPVTGGSMKFFGATGEIHLTDISESEDETMTLYEADLVLPRHSDD
jgi:hypothetical protein